MPLAASARPRERLTQRNGYRPRPWQTRAGELELQIPKLRHGSYFPSFLEPRRRSEQALVEGACVAGVSTLKVDQVVESLGRAGSVGRRTTPLRPWNFPWKHVKQSFSGRNCGVRGT